MNKKIYKLNLECLDTNKYNEEKEFLTAEDIFLTPMEKAIKTFNKDNYNITKICKEKLNNNEKMYFEYNNKYYILKRTDLRMTDCKQCDFNKDCNNLNHCIVDILTSKIEEGNYCLKEISLYEIEFGDKNE